MALSARLRPIDRKTIDELALDAMPEENPIPDAVERVAHALESLDSEPPKAPSKRDRLKSIASLLASIAALLTAAGAFIKTFDHSITENAYNTLSKQITALSDEQDKNHQDIVALRGYLDGLTHAPLIPIASASAVASASIPAMSASSHPPPVATLRPLVRPGTDGGSPASALRDTDGGIITFTFAIDAPPVPSVHPKFEAMKMKDWDKVEKGL